MSASAIQWATFAAASTAALGALVAAGIYARQTRIMNRARRGAHFVDILQRLQAEEARSHRETVYTMSLTPDDLTKSDHDAARKAVESVAHTFDLAAIMVRLDMLPKEFSETWAWPIARCWKHVEPWALYRRNRREDIPYLWTDLEQLAGVARENLLRRGLGTP